MSGTAASDRTYRVLSLGGYAGLALAIMALPHESKAEDSPVGDDAGDENQFFGDAALTYAF